VPVVLVTNWGNLQTVNYFSKFKSFTMVKHLVFVTGFSNNTHSSKVAVQAPTDSSGVYVITLTDKHTMNGGDWVEVSLIIIQADSRCVGTVVE
jgi:hypothetical protein